MKRSVMLFIFAFMGCASIITGTRQNIKINSTPTGAKVKIMQGQDMIPKNILAWEGTTPATVKLRREYQYMVIISLEGYKTTEVNLEHGRNGWVWWNILFGGILGFAVDFSNGAAEKLKPNEIHVELIMSSTPYGEKMIYAVLQALDVNGESRVISVPLIPESHPLSSRL